MNPNSLKSRFMTRFLRALTKINGQKPVSSSSSPREMFRRRYRRIKVAADKSMAYSVRSRRIWSRALLWKLRNRSRSSRRLASSGRRSEVKASTTTSRRAITKKTKETGEIDEVEGDELREVVPGGEAMDLCKLLDETAHYIKCLTTQVQVMRKIVDFYE